MGKLKKKFIHNIKIIVHIDRWLLEKNINKWAVDINKKRKKIKI